MTQYNVRGVWMDSNGRRHQYQIYTDTTDRGTIKDIVRSQYPVKSIIINSVRPM